MQRVLKDAKLLETAEKLSKRIAERFPESGLSQVAAEVVQITQEAAVRAAGIRRPNVWLRAGLIVLLAIAVAAGASCPAAQQAQPLHEAARRSR